MRDAQARTVLGRIMVRLDRRRLENATFPERIEIATRFADLDVQGHVNNVAVAVIFQEARGRFNRSHVAPFLGAGRGLVVGSLFIDYAGQMYFPDPVTVSIGVLEIGRSSFVLGKIARQNGRITAFAEATLVSTSPEGTAPLTVETRAALGAAMIVGYAGG
jgi:acyl-CoA thioester hydrolase